MSASRGSTNPRAPYSRPAVGLSIRQLRRIGPPPARLAASQPYDAGTPSATPVDPSGPDIAELGARIAGVYRDTALSLPIPEAELLPEGIYLLCENDVVYAGTSQQMLAAVHSLNIAQRVGEIGAHLKLSVTPPRG